MSLLSRLIGLPTFICLLAGAAVACRYNVRDVGFVDLGVDTCTLFALVDSESSPAMLADFKAAISEAFSETDIRSELINTADDPGHPAVSLAETAGVTSPPAALFVAPDGRFRTFTFASEGATSRTTLASRLDALASSPLRNQIAEACAARYAVVLIIEGPDAQENAAAISAARAATKFMTEHLNFLPKPVAAGPLTLTLARDAFELEELLLWCLNLAPEQILRPHAAIFYGRARQIGPVLKGDEVTENMLANILSLIGADCECGLDRRWMEGPLLPAKWSTETRARLVKSLGFDPDSPMVKMEVSMILRKGAMSSGRWDVAGLGSVPYGYQEIVIDFDDPKAPANESMITLADESLVRKAPQSSLPPENASRPGRNTGESLPFAAALALLAGCGAAVVGIGIAIYWRAHLRA
ncbi:MAG: hypothetical protein IH624_01280 [Phycisphaerae bacterium]|nr:hypothetical protein [Phycisphaerae bacterium]